MRLSDSSILELADRELFFREEEQPQDNQRNKLRQMHDNGHSNGLFLADSVKAEAQIDGSVKRAHISWR